MTRLDNNATLPCIFDFGALQGNIFCLAQCLLVCLEFSMEPESINRNRGQPHAITAPEAQKQQFKERICFWSHRSFTRRRTILDSHGDDTRKIEKDSCDSNKEKNFQVGATCYSTYKHTRSKSGLTREGSTRRRPSNGQSELLMTKLLLWFRGLFPSPHPCAER